MRTCSHYTIVGSRGGNGGGETQMSLLYILFNFLTMIETFWFIYPLVAVILNEVSPYQYDASHPEPHNERFYFLFFLFLRVLLTFHHSFNIIIFFFHFIGDSQDCSFLWVLAWPMMTTTVLWRIAAWSRFGCKTVDFKRLLKKDSLPMSLI